MPVGYGFKRACHRHVPDDDVAVDEQVEAGQRPNIWTWYRGHILRVRPQMRY